MSQSQRSRPMVHKQSVEKFHGVHLGEIAL
jgi:hypothetical protein